jgi:hypothetical protein
MTSKIMAVLAVVLTGLTSGYCQTNTQIQPEDLSKLIISTNWIYPSPQYRYIGKTLYNTYSAPFQWVAIPDDVISINAGVENGPASDTSEHDTILSAHGGHSASTFDAGKSWVYRINNFPYFRRDWKGGKPVTDHLRIQAVLVSEHITYINDGHDIGHIQREYDCGTPMTSPVCIITTNTLGHLKQMAQKKEALLSENKNRAIKFNQDAADKGDAYGLMRMGERNRDGDGVPKDLAKAKDYLTKAAAAGSPDAADELKQLPAN